jgi:hypothetical protein
MNRLKEDRTNITSHQPLAIQFYRYPIYTDCFLVASTYASIGHGTASMYYFALGYKYMAEYHPAYNNWYNAVSMSIYSGNKELMDDCYHKLKRFLTTLSQNTQNTTNAQTSPELHKKVLWKALRLSAQQRNKEFFDQWVKATVSFFTPSKGADSAKETAYYWAMDACRTVGNTNLELAWFKKIQDEYNTPNNLYGTQLALYYFQKVNKKHGELRLNGNNIPTAYTTQSTLFNVVTASQQVNVSLQQSLPGNKSQDATQKCSVKPG